jgi:NAD(P)-dependent dehydrogenase (short-subunit alcohol dehydrogenase family)
MVHQSLIDLVNLDGRRAVVTGAGSGIGRATASTLMHAGASVLALDLTGTDTTVDVADYDAVERVLRNEKPDIVVNCAGIMAPDSLATTGPDDWERVLAVNLTGYYHVLKCAVPRMNRPGSIVQISSMQAHIGVAFPAYTAAKGAVISLSRQLAAELGPDGIRVNSVSPGMILTGMTEDHLANGPETERVTSRTPVRRIGKAQDIANAVLYLASDLSTFVTGTDILVDGGITSALNL